MRSACRHAWAFLALCAFFAMFQKCQVVGCRKEQKSLSGSTTCCQTTMRLSRPLPDAPCSSRNPLLLMCLKMLQQQLGQAATGIEPWHEISSNEWMPMVEPEATWVQDASDAYHASACAEFLVIIMQCPSTSAAADQLGDSFHHPNSKDA